MCCVSLSSGGKKFCIFDNFLPFILPVGPTGFTRSDFLVLSLFPYPLPLGLLSWATWLDSFLQPCCWCCFNFSFHSFNIQLLILVFHAFFHRIVFLFYRYTLALLSFWRGIVYFSSICFVVIVFYSLYYLCFHLGAFCMFVFSLSCWRLFSNVKYPGCLSILMNEAIKTWIKLYVWGQHISWGLLQGASQSSC